MLSDISVTKEWVDYSSIIKPWQKIEGQVTYDNDLLMEDIIE